MAAATITQITAINSLRLPALARMKWNVAANDDYVLSMLFCWLFLECIFCSFQISREHEENSKKNAEAKQKTDQYHHPLGLWFGIRCNCNFEHDTAEWHSAFRGCGTSSKKKTQKTNNIYLVQIIVKWIESSLMLHRVRRANAAAFAELKYWSEKETNNARKQFLFQFRIKAFDCDMILHCLIKCN